VGILVSKNRQSETHRLRRLLESFYRLSSSLELGVVLRETLETATELMDARTGSIALIDERREHLVFVESTDADVDRLKSFSVPLGEGIAGHVASSGQSIRVEDVATDTRFYDGIDRNMGSRTRSYLCVPLIVNDQVIGTAQLMNRRDGKAFTEDDEELMEGFARQAALAIQNARFHELSLRQKAIDSELAICAEIQRNLFPAARPEITGFEVFGSSRPCHQVGGDYFTYLDRPDGSWDLVIADVSGKGLAAAMTVSELHTGLRLLSPVDVPLNEMANRLNAHLRESLVAGRFVSLFALRIQPGRQEIDYVVAGHPPPRILSSRGEVCRLDRTGPILGVLDQDYPSASVELAPGELILSWTDGYSEATDRAGLLLGDEAVVDTALDAIGRDLTEIRARLDDRAKAFRQGSSSCDDETLLLVRRQPMA